MPLLTPEERRRLTPQEKKALRKQRRLERWPETDGRPPWVRKATLALKSLAFEAVIWAADQHLAGGRERHDAAVKRVTDRAGITNGFATELVAEAVWRAFRSLEDENYFDKEGE